MKTLVSAVLLGAVLVSTAQAAPFTGIDATQSRVTFRYQQMGVAMDGKFKTFSSQLQFDPAQAAKATGRLDIDLASIATGSSEADAEVVGKAWFNVAAHPKASFVLKQLQATGPNRYDALGQLTIKGQTRDVRAPLQLTPPNRLSGSFVLKRADFAIGEGMWAKFDVVANDITVQFQLSLK